MSGPEDNPRDDEPVNREEYERWEKEKSTTQWEDVNVPVHTAADLRQAVEQAVAERDKVWEQSVLTNYRAEVEGHANTPFTRWLAGYLREQVLGLEVTIRQWKAEVEVEKFRVEQALAKIPVMLKEGLGKNYSSEYREVFEAIAAHDTFVRKQARAEATLVALEAAAEHPLCLAMTVDLDRMYKCRCGELFETPLLAKAKT